LATTIHKFNWGLRFYPVRSGYALLLVVTAMVSSCSKESEPPEDNVAPVINVISPVNKMTYEVNNIPLSWSINEENYKKGYFKINGGKEYEIGKTGSKDTVLANGTYTVHFFAEDKSSNKSSKTIEMIVNKPAPDTTPPKISFSTPENNKTYVTGEVPFSWNISDASGVASSSYSLNGVNKNINSTGSETLNLTNGNYELKVRAVDTKENVKDTTVNFVVNIPPTYKYTINPFVQPNDSTLNYYGSGDVDGNNKVEQNDVNKLEQIINGTFTPNLESNDPVEYRTLDRADVNGDEKVDSTDKQILQEKLNGTREYLPCEWNKLKTRAEREEWFQKMKKINEKSSTFPKLGVDDCNVFSWQTQINFHGTKDYGFEGTIEYGNRTLKLRDNGRFNIHMCEVTVAPNNPDYAAHRMNTFIPGEAISTYSDWFFFEPQYTHGDGKANDWLMQYAGGNRAVIKGPPRNKDFGSEGIATIRILNNKITSYNVNSNPEIRIIKTRSESNGLK